MFQRMDYISCGSRLEMQPAIIRKHNAFFLIDKEKPKIRYVEELEGRSLKEFCWKYEKKDVIQDYTFCSEELFIGMEVLCKRRADCKGGET